MINFLSYKFLCTRLKYFYKTSVASHSCTVSNSIQQNAHHHKSIAPKNLFHSLIIKTVLVVLIIGFQLKSANAQSPIIYLVSAKQVAAVKKSAKTNKATADNVAALSKQADKIMEQKFGSVIDKKFIPPCGNMHEYMSMARYYWPDPAKPDGKPYIKKDGEKNPANDLVSDDKNFDNLIAAVQTLSWAYYFTNEEKYAAKSTELIRFWFLDTATRMLPNLNHAQIRTGIDTGASSGIIDTHSLPQVVDAIGLLRSSKAWKSTDEQGIKQWFTDYLHWMRTSVSGKKEAEAKNNHGTFYDNQIAIIALFCGNNITADKIFKTEFDRIESQIEPDGKQPLELVRTASLGYSTFNLEAWSMLANAAETRGIDLWHYETKDGRSIKKAIDYLLPFVTGGKKWEYQQINTYKAQDFYRLLLIAAGKFKDDNYRKQAEKIKDSNKNILVKLFYEQ